MIPIPHSEKANLWRQKDQWLRGGQRRRRDDQQSTEDFQGNKIYTQDDNIMTNTHYYTFVQDPQNVQNQE